jgi:pyrimidine-nucleoside phosphorylase
MVETGERMGKKVVALITDMDQPLGRMIGNALEVVEVVEVLRGEGPEDLRQLCIELAGWMLHLGGVADEVEDGKTAERETDRFRQRARSVSSDGGTAGRRSASS